MSPSWAYSRIAVSWHLFAPEPEGPRAVVLVGRDDGGPFAALLAVDRRRRPIPMTPGAVLELAALAHQLAARVILACSDAVDQLAAVAAVKLTIAAGDVWRIEDAALAGWTLQADQVALVRGPSVDVLERAAGWPCDRLVATVNRAVRS